MRQVRLVPKDGWARISEVLSDLEPGDEVVLAPGIYSGGETLFVGTGIHLRGESGAILEFAGDADNVDAISVSGDNVAVSELAIRARTPCRALISTEQTTGLRVAQCDIDGTEQSNFGVSIAGAKCVELFENRCRNTTDGIYLSSSQGLVARNECWANEEAGIALSESDSPDTTSETEIVENRCHHNTGTGMRLSVFHGLAVRNECWANGRSGITAFGSVSPYILAEAKVTENRCHHNTHSGILLSLFRGLVARNECWANEENGIAVAGLDSLDSPAKPDVTENRCHHNGEAGITLASSRGLVTRNECWANIICGIVLRPDQTSMATPSKAEVRANRCHHNSGAGIVFLSSEGKAEGNECWDNEVNAIVLERYPDVAAVASEVERVGNLESCAISPEALREARLQGNPAAGLIRALEAVDPERGEALAHYLVSGCAGCFDRVWAGDDDSQEALAMAEPSPTPIAAGEVGAFRVTLNRIGEVEILAAERPQPDSLETQFQSLARSCVQPSREAPAITLALVTASDEPIEHFVDALQATTGRGAPRNSMLEDLTDASYLRVAPPVVVDCRHSAAQDQAGANIDQAISQDRKRWLDRTVLLLTGLAWLPWVAMLATPWVADRLGYPSALGYWRDVIGSTGDWVFEQSWSTQLVGGGALVLAMTLLLSTFINLFLPAALRIELPLVERWTRGLLGLFLDQLGAALDTVKEWATQRLPRLEPLNWRRWVRYRLFGFGWDRPDIVVVCLKNVEHWDAPTIRRLRDLFAARRPDQALLCVTHMGGLSALVNGFLEVWYPVQDDGQGHQQGAQFSEALLLHQPAAAEIGAPGAVAMDPGEALRQLAAILGWRKPVEERAGARPVLLPEDRRRELLASLLDATWTFRDMLPTLVLGSTPAAPMHIARTVADARRQYSKALSAEMEPYYRVFVPESDDTPPLEEVPQAFAWAELADGVLMYRAPGQPYGDHNEWYELLGRGGYRRSLAEALRGLGPGDVVEPYLRRHALCGEIYHLCRVRRLLVGDGQAPDADLTHIALHLEAAVFLLRERLSKEPVSVPGEYSVGNYTYSVSFEGLAHDIASTTTGPYPTLASGEADPVESDANRNQGPAAGPEVSDSPMALVHILWRAISDLLRQPPSSSDQIDKPYPAAVHLYSTLLAASALFAGDASRPSPVPSDGVRSELVTWLADPEHYRSDGSVRGAFLEELLTSLASLRLMDEAIGEELLEQRLRQDWFRLPADIKETLRHALGERVPIAFARLARAQELTDLMTLVQAYRHTPRILLACMGSLAAAYARATWNSSDSRSATAYWQALEQAGSGLLCLMSGVPRYQANCEPLPLVTDLPPTAGRMALEALRDTDFTRAASEILARGAEELRTTRDTVEHLGRMDIEGIAFGAYGSVNRIIKKHERQTIALLRGNPGPTGAR